MDIKIGEVVRLKSGGPQMTIVRQMSAETVACQWFVENDLFERIFVIESLNRTIR